MRTAFLGVSALLSFADAFYAGSADAIADALADATALPSSAPSPAPTSAFVDTIAAHFVSISVRSGSADALAAASRASAPMPSHTPSPRPRLLGPPTSSMELLFYVPLVLFDRRPG